MIFETQIMDFEPPKDGRIKFLARVEDIMHNVNTIMHLDLVIKQITKAKDVDGVTRAVKVWRIPKGESDLPAAFRHAWPHSYTGSVCQSVIQKMENVLNNTH